MWYKVWWLFLWMTLAFWVGCAGENQNYRINHEPRTPLREGHPTHPAYSEAAGDEVPLVGLQRDNWPAVALAPDSGRVLHHPQYWSRYGGGRIWLASDERPSALRLDGDLAAQAHTATAGARHRLSLTDLGDQALQTTKFAADTLLFPVYVIADPPTHFHSSPQD